LATSVFFSFAGALKGAPKMRAETKIAMGSGGIIFIYLIGLAVVLSGDTS
jgi:hypothetical protein